MFDAGKDLLCVQFVADVQEQVAVSPNDARTKKRFTSFELRVGQEHLAARASRLEHLCGEPGNIKMNKASRESRLSHLSQSDPMARRP